MSREQPTASGPRSFEHESTEAGRQTLVPGVAPITPGDRLHLLAQAPMQPRARQRPADHGLFDENARKQIEMF